VVREISYDSYSMFNCSILGRWSSVFKLYDVEVRKYKDVNLKDGVVIDGFPSVGLVSSISASYIIATLNLDQVAVLDSEGFPPISMIYGGKPKFPARIHASESYKTAVFSAEFTPNPMLDRPIAKRIFSWTREHSCRLIITVVGQASEGDEGSEGETHQVFAVGSTDNARQLLDVAGVPELNLGMITGIPSTLLNEGKWANYDVIAVLVSARRDIADTLAAAKALEAIGKIVPDLKVDLDPLLEEGERIEARIKSMRSQVATVEPPAGRDIYR
jgi:uncharacterized protein